MTPDPTPPTLEFKALLWLLVIVSALFALVLYPYFGAVCWAVFLAIVFWPLHLKLVAGLRNRNGWAAFASLALIVVIVILPLGLVAASVTQEASALVERVRAGDIQIGAYLQKVIDALPAWVHGLLERFGLANLGLMQKKLVASVGQSGQALTAQAFIIGQNTLDFVVSFFVMLYMVFFLLRDGRSLADGIARAIPLRADHTQRLLAQFSTVVRATVKGNVVVALIQGALGALAFWVLGLPGPMLWGAVMALLSLLPAVGAALVWGPVAAYFLFTGEIARGVGLAAWGVLVIGLVDNVLRPVLVGKDTRMPDYLVLVATLGGIAVFGLNGFVIGPVIAAMFLVAWDLFASARPPQARAQRAVPEAGGDRPPPAPRRRRRRPSAEPPERR